MEFVYEDCKSLLEQVNLQEKELRNKRRWLIGLPTSPSKSKASSFQSERPIPEYLLREDDVSYEAVNSFVEKLVGECNSKNKYHIHQDMQLIHSPTDMAGLFYLIDDMTNQGLLRFAEELTGGLIKFEETRLKMKQIIKGCLSEVYSKQSNTWQMNLSESHSSLLKNPHNFRWSSESRFIPKSDSCHVAVHNILDVLENLPTQTLCAMHRKLRCIKGYTPKLIPKKSGWGRDPLIKRLRKKCFGLLSKLHKGDSLQEPLAKAMEVAGLTLKLIQQCNYVPNFRQFSPEINILQNEIAMSIQLLDHGVKKSVLKDIQVLLDPNAKLSDRKLQSSIRNLLMEYLFECGDMETVPQCLLEVLAAIRKISKVPYKHLPEMKIKEETECILRLSASMKQVLWDMIPDHEFDLEYADAYMEDLKESDVDTFEDVELDEHMQNSMSVSTTSEVGSTGEIIPDNFISVENSKCMAEISSIESHSLKFLEVPISQGIHAMQYHLVSLGSKEHMNADYPADTNRPFRNSIGEQGQTHMSENSPDVSSKVSSVERNMTYVNQSMCKNQYLAVQSASDKASMVVYRLIGRMLDDFAQKEGCELNYGDRSYLGAGSSDLKQKNLRVTKDSATHKEDGSIIFKAVEELIPFFAKCETDGLKELMGSSL